MRASLAVAVAVAVIGAAACGDQAPTTVGALTLDPPAATTPAGRGVRFTPHLADGDVELALPAAPTWQVRDPLIAEVRTVDGEVVVIGRAPGSTVVSAWLDGQEARAALTVRPAEPEALELVPPRAAVTSGDCTSFTAHLHYSDGRVVSLDGTDVAWGGDFPLSPDGRGAYCPFGAEGTFAVWASHRGLFARAQLDVTLAAVTDLTLFGTTDVPVGIDVAFDAQATFADGLQLLVTDRALWQSSDPAVLTAPVGGAAHAAGLGAATLSATFGGVTRTLDVVVRAPRLQFLWLTPSTATVAVGATTAVTATGAYDDSGQRDVTAAATWTSSAPERATVAGGVITGVGPGPATIRADLDGLCTSAPVTVTP